MSRPRQRRDSLRLNYLIRTTWSFLTQPKLLYKCLEPLSYLNANTVPLQRVADCLSREETSAVKFAPVFGIFVRSGDPSSRESRPNCPKRTRLMCCCGFERAVYCARYLGPSLGDCELARELLGREWSVSLNWATPSSSQTYKHTYTPTSQSCT
jgi:hypothetical protein